MLCWKLESIPSIKEQLNKCTYYIRCTIRTLLQHASNFKLPTRYQYVMGEKFIGISAEYVDKRLERKFDERRDFFKLLTENQYHYVYYRPDP